MLEGIVENVVQCLAVFCGELLRIDPFHILVVESKLLTDGFDGFDLVLLCCILLFDGPRLDFE